MRRVVRQPQCVTRFIALPLNVVHITRRIAFNCIFLVMVVYITRALSTIRPHFCVLSGRRRLGVGVGLYLLHYIIRYPN